MFDTFSERMRRVVSQAYGEARGRGDPEIRPAHRFLAILKVKGGDACEALANLGVDEVQAWTAKIRVMGPGGNTCVCLSVS